MRMTITLALAILCLSFTAGVAFGYDECRGGKEYSCTVDGTRTNGMTEKFYGFGRTSSRAEARATMACENESMIYKCSTPMCFSDSVEPGVSYTCQARGALGNGFEKQTYGFARTRVGAEARALRNCALAGAYNCQTSSCSRENDGEYCE